jgi:hypothetical protein
VLRTFGLVLAAFIAVVFGTLLPWLGWLAVHAWPWGLAAALALVALAAPALLSPVFAAWTRVGLVLGWINTRLLLGLVFFGLILPFGLARRVSRHAPIAKAPEADRETYRLSSRVPERDHFDRPY